jgi:hypothetical protein
MMEKVGYRKGLCNSLIALYKKGMLGESET